MGTQQNRTTCAVAIRVSWVVMCSLDRTHDSDPNPPVRTQGKWDLLSPPGIGVVRSPMQSCKRAFHLAVFFVFCFTLRIQAFVSKADSGGLRTTPDDSGRLGTTSEDSRRLHLRTILADSIRLQTALDDSRRFWTTPDHSRQPRTTPTPDNSGRLGTTRDDS